MKASFVFGFILLILLIIGIFVGAPYVAQIIKSGAFELPFSLPFSLPKIINLETPFPSRSETGFPQQAGTPTPSPNIKIGESIYKDKINIGSVYFSGGGQISLKSSYFSQDSVNITGWKIKSFQRGETIIGKGINLPQFDAAPSDIRLSSGESAEIVIGLSPLATNFRANNCFGWLNNLYNLGYSLDYCPGGFKLADLTGLDSACQDLILRASSCQLPNEDDLNKSSYQCRDWALKNMNYGACVTSYKNDGNFYKGWKIYTGNNNQIFDSLHDKIELRDQNGLLVDSYDY